MNLDQTFALLVGVALRGERCPHSHWDRLHFQAPAEPPSDLISSDHVTALARQGRILVEISGRNYRTVTILEGPHAGKKTAPDPSGRVWKTIGRKTVTNTMVERGERTIGPSAPRRI